MKRWFTTLILANLSVLFASQAFALNIQRDTPVWLPVILVSGDNTSRATVGVTGTWTPGFTISYSEPQAGSNTWVNLAPTTSNFRGVTLAGANGGGVYEVSFTAAQVGPGKSGFFKYFVSIDSVTAPYYGIMQITSISMDTTTSNDAIMKASVDTNGVAVRWADIKGPTSVVGLTGTTILKANSVDEVKNTVSGDAVRQVVHVNSADQVHILDTTLARVTSTDATNINTAIIARVTSVDAVTVVLQPIGRTLSVDQVSRTLSVEDVRHLQSGDSVRVILDSVGRALSVDQVSRVLSTEDVRHLQSGDSVRVILDSVGRVLSVDQVARVLSAEDVRHLQSGDSVRVILDSVGRVLSVDQVQRLISGEYVRYIVSGDEIREVRHVTSLDTAGLVVSVDPTAVGLAVWGRASSDFTVLGTMGGQINSMDRRIGKPDDHGTESIHGKIGEQNKMSNDLADSIRIYR